MRSWSLQRHTNRFCANACLKNAEELRLEVSVKRKVNWKDATAAEQELFIAMTKLFSGHEKLLDFVFACEKPSLRIYPDALIEQAKGLSGGEHVLVRLALDIWSDSGGVRISELLNRLDSTSFENAMTALRYVGPKGKSGLVSRASDPAWDGVFQPRGGLKDES
jgi:hypothetical protein